MQTLKTKFLQFPGRMELPPAFLHKYAPTLSKFYFKVLFILKGHCSSEKNN